MTEQVDAVSGELLAPEAEAPITALARAEIDVQVATAKRWPRSLKAFRERAMAMATTDQETAASMIYAKPVQGRTVQGPSIRLAEVVAATYGNLRCDSRIVEIGSEFVEARAMCFDIESNVAEAVTVMRRIVDKNGKRYGESMIETACAAAMAIAKRNAVFRVIPRAYVDRIYAKCRDVAVGDAQTMAATRDKFLGIFARMGVVKERVLAALELETVEEITADHLTRLLGWRNAIKDEGAKVDEVFPELPPDLPKRKAAPARKPRKKPQAAPESGGQEGSASAAAETRRSKAPADSPEGGSNPPPPPSPAPTAPAPAETALISKEQRQELIDAMEPAGYEIEDLTAHVAAKYQVFDLRQLPADLFETLLDAIKARKLVV